MNKFERVVLVLAVGAPLLMVTVGTRFDGWFGSLGFVAFLSNAVAVFIVFRDLFRRDFADRNAKLKWVLWIVLTSGIAMVFYVFKHGLQPRTGAGPA